jgi:solute:Na+ symporter, SSS family
MQSPDWLILFGMIVFCAFVAWRTKKYSRGVADFLAANRCAKRYIIAASDGVNAMGAISVIAIFQLYMEGGFTPVFWSIMTVQLVMLIVAISGWVIYRFRQTRALTWPQFFEMRYSRQFRIFAGALCFISGIINFGIFPSVAARFMVYYCRLPVMVNVAGYELSTYGLVMAGILALAVWFACLGGQVTIMVTDFLQALLCNVIFIVLLAVLMVKFNWSDVAASLANRPPAQSMINPFQITDLKNYNLWYYLIIVFVAFYNAYSWQGQQGFNTSAKDAHEARMAKILGMLRPLSSTLFLLFLPLCVYTLLHNPKYAGDPIVSAIQSAIHAVEQPQYQSQMTVPIALSYILPVGLVGAFCTVIFIFSVSTLETYLHSWGSILLQDVIMPLRKKRFTPAHHINYLRLSIIAVAVFAWFWSFYFDQKSDILMFFALSGMLYLCGQGAVTVGGLYWKRGTAAGAWVAMILNLPIFALAFAADQFWPRIAAWLQNSHPETWASLQNTFPTLNAREFLWTNQEIYFFGMALCLTAYIVVSLLTCRKPFNLDQMLHQGRYAETDENKFQNNDLKNSGAWDWKDVLGFKRGMVFGDKFVFGFAYGYLILYLLAVVVMTLWHVLYGTTDNIWLAFWQGFVWLNLVLTVVVIVWFAVGGLRDMKDLFSSLASTRRDARDDGVVDESKNNTR